MRKVLAVTLILAITVLGASAIEFHEVGIQIEISLRPFLENGTPRWDFTIGPYARMTLTDQYSARLVVGTAVTPFTPFADLIIFRAMSPEWTLEAGLLVEIIPARSIAATASVGTRLTIGAPPNTRFELASFPFGWRLEAADGRLHGDFLLSGNLLLDVTLASGGPLLIGQGFRATVTREVRGPEPAVISIGSGWALGIDLLTHIGTGL